MRRTRGKKGFTLVEILAAVGIVALLCAIAIPAIGRAGRSLDQQQADDYAKSIYLAIQDELASKRVDGSIEVIGTDYASIYADNGTALKEEIAGMLSALAGEGSTVKPADLLDQDKNREYVYITTDDRDELAKDLLPMRSVDKSIFNGDPEITVIFNKKTGDVLLVQYKTAKVIGTYDGGIISGGTSILEEMSPTVQFVNAQECCVKIAIPVLGMPNPKEFLDKITYTITVKDAAAEENYFCYQFSRDSFNTTLPDSEDMIFKVNYATGVAEWTLDSMNPQNGSFAQKMQDCMTKAGTIDAGSNVLVEVQCTYKDEGGKDVELLGASAAGNPLFSYLGPDEADESCTVIEIGNGRHLQNLNRLSDEVAAQVDEVRITRDIKWNETAIYYENRIRQNDILAFEPLDTPVFKDGNEITLVGAGADGAAMLDGFYINPDSGKDAGLFSMLKGTVKNITLVDPCIRTDSGYAGALAARAQGANIIGCGVHILEQQEDYSVFGSESVGLLLGDAKNTTVSDAEVQVDDACSVSAYGLSFGLVAGSDTNGSYTNIRTGGSIAGGTAASVGGIIGTAEYCAISTAETDVTAKKIGSEDLGGLVGKVKGGSCRAVNVNAVFGSSESANNRDNREKNIRDCSVGGLFGSAEDVTVSGSNTVNAAFTNFFECNYTGGAIGYAKSGTYSGITVNGSMNDMDSGCLGGAIGRADGGSFNSITTKVSMKVRSAWTLEEGLAVVGIPADLQTYASPAGAGYAGSFVGYIGGGTFKNCASAGAAAGIGVTTYDALQFLGVIKPTQHQEKNGLFECDQRLSGEIAADEDINDETAYIQNGGTARFIPSTIYYGYDGIQLDNCTFRSGSKTYRVVLKEDRNYYTHGEVTEGYQYVFTKLTSDTFSYNDLKSEYLIMDSEGKHAIGVQGSRIPILGGYYYTPVLIDADLGENGVVRSDDSPELYKALTEQNALWRNNKRWSDFGVAARSIEIANCTLTGEYMSVDLLGPRVGSIFDRTHSFDYNEEGEYWQITGGAAGDYYLAITARGTELSFAGGANTHLKLFVLRGADGTAGGSTDESREDTYKKTVFTLASSNPSRIVSFEEVK